MRYSAHMACTSSFILMANLWGKLLVLSPSKKLRHSKVKAHLHRKLTLYRLTYDSPYINFQLDHQPWCFFPTRLKLFNNLHHTGISTSYFSTPGGREQEADKKYLLEDLQWFPTAYSRKAKKVLDPLWFTVQWALDCNLDGESWREAPMPVLSTPSSQSLIPAEHIVGAQ